MKTRRDAARTSLPAPAWSAWDILASLGDSLAVVDTSYRVVWAREPLLPSGGSQNLAGRFCYQIFAGRQDVCPQGCPVRQVLASGSAQVVERQVVLPDGGVLWREARAYPIHDGAGRVALVARISFDISRRKASQSRQAQRREALERSLAAMNRLGLGDLPFQGGLERALTARELEVLRLLSQGLRKPQIAGVLGLSPHTVKRHVDNIFAKLSVNDRAQAAVWAAHQGLV
ncbi:MAG: LuxR C-terminal-related transcriptional regulator [Pseudomonadota bacterium]